MTESTGCFCEVTLSLPASPATLSTASASVTSETARPAPPSPQPIQREGDEDEDFLVLMST